MNPLFLTTAFLGLALALGLFYLIRRDHLHLSHGLFWMAVAVAALLFGFWPRLIDILAGTVGIQYPPTLLLLAAILILLVKGIYTDMALTRQARQLRRLTQHMALFEARLQRADDAASKAHGPKPTPGS
jgi:hypothetical protein